MDSNKRSKSANLLLPPEDVYVVFVHISNFFMIISNMTQSEQIFLFKM